MIKLTVFFEEPFWTGIFERLDESKIEVCRVVFGEEPKDYEIYEYILKNYYSLKFSKPLSIDENIETKINPKRMQRKIKKAVQEKGVGTKAQQAIKFEYENMKVERKLQSKERHEIREKIKFEKKQEKKKQKKRGH